MQKEDYSYVDDASLRELMRMAGTHIKSSKPEGSPEGHSYVKDSELEKLLATARAAVKPR